MSLLVRSTVVLATVLSGCGGATTTTQSAPPGVETAPGAREVAVVDPVLPLADPMWVVSPAHLYEPLPWSPGLSFTPCEVRYHDAHDRLTAAVHYRYDGAGRLIGFAERELPHDDSAADTAPGPPPEEEEAPEDYSEPAPEHEWPEPPIYCGSVSQSLAPFTTLEWTEQGRVRCARNEGPDEDPTRRCFEYDAEGRLVSWAADDGSEQGSVRWDDAGRPAEIEGSFWFGEAVDAMTLEYEGARLSRIRRSFEGNDSGSRVSWAYRYDARGRVSSVDIHEEVSWEGPDVATRERSYALHRDEAGLVERCEHDGYVVRYVRAQGRLVELRAERAGQLVSRIDFRYECAASAQPARAGPPPRAAAPRAPASEARVSEAEPDPRSPTRPAGGDVGAELRRLTHQARTEPANEQRIRALCALVIRAAASCDSEEGRFAVESFEYECSSGLPEQLDALRGATAALAEDDDGEMDEGGQTSAERAWSAAASLYRDELSVLELRNVERECPGLDPIVPSAVDAIIAGWVALGQGG